MSAQAIARRYSSALADVVTKSGETVTVQNELNQFEAMMTSSPDLTEVFKNPAIPYEQKSKVLESLLGKTKPNNSTANFLRILLKNYRLADLSEINKKFAVVLDERAGLVSADVTTAKTLSPDEQKNLQVKLEKVTGKKVNLSYSIDESIIGGVITKIGSTIYDGSVKTQLQQLKEKMIRS